MIRSACLQALALAAAALLPALVCGGLQVQWRAPENGGSVAPALPEEPLEPGEVRPATARQWGSQVFYVDARSQERYDAGHIPGAFRLTQEEWETLAPKFADAWDPDKTVIVYCDGGKCEASRELAERLKREFQIDSYVLKGGWPAWQRE